MNEPPLHSSPFRRPTEASRIAVVRDTDPYAAAREALAAFDLTPARGKTVLLKPNAGRLAAPDAGVTTHPAVVAAAIDAFREAGARVRVGESPITGVNTLEAFEVTGIAAVARERNCPLIDLDARPCRRVALPDGHVIRELQVCADVLEADLVVSIPVMKIHMHTGVTLAVKNMKGCLWRRSKVELHMLPLLKGVGDRALDIAIADMSWALRPHLALLDGTTGMEGLGPSAGTPKHLGVVVAGADAYAADAVACRLMGRRAAEIAHLRIGAERGYGVIEIDRLSVTPDGWERFAQPFAAAPENLSMKFPNVNVLDKQSCSACQSTLMLFLQRHGDELAAYVPEGEKLNIAIGRGHEDLPAGTICVGNCTACHRESSVFVPGCPPVASNIRKAIQRDRPGSS